jgi:hypothetical protein
VYDYGQEKKEGEMRRQGDREMGGVFGGYFLIFFNNYR